eukprot:scaffold7384_cov396-Prasinococcus_capsulatus_cf.AAC.7
MTLNHRVPARRTEGPGGAPGWTLGAARGLRTGGPGDPATGGADGPRRGGERALPEHPSRGPLRARGGPLKGLCGGPRAPGPPPTGGPLPASQEWSRKWRAPQRHAAWAPPAQGRPCWTLGLHAGPLGAPGWASRYGPHPRASLSAARGSGPPEAQLVRRGCPGGGGCSGRWRVQGPRASGVLSVRQ